MYNEAFISSHFGHCTLAWILGSRRLDGRQNLIQERGMFTVYNDRFSTFEQFVHKEDSVSVHIRNFQDLATAIYKAKKKKRFLVFWCKIFSDSLTHHAIFEDAKLLNRNIFGIKNYNVIISRSLDILTSLVI